MEGLVQGRRVLIPRKLGIVQAREGINGKAKGAGFEVGLSDLPRQWAWGAG